MLAYVFKPAFKLTSYLPTCQPVEGRGQGIKLRGSLTVSASAHLVVTVGVPGLCTLARHASLGVPARQNDSLLALGLTVSIPGLEKALQQYTLEPSEKPFDLKSVPLATTPMAEQRPGKALLIPKAHLFPLTVECPGTGWYMQRGSR